MENDVWNLWSPWLRNSDSPWEKVLHFADKRYLNRNDIVPGYGPLFDGVYYLYKGEVKGVILDSGGEEKPIWYIESGHIFGETPFLLRGESNVIFTCVSDCILFAFSRQVIMEKILPNNQEIMLDMLHGMASKIQSLARQIYNLSLTSPKMRLYRLLYTMSLGANNALNISQQDLADLLGMHRVTLNKILIALKNEGIIERDINRKRITIADRTSLFSLMEKEGN
jgi:CRP-like cAMP-binding protein